MMEESEENQNNFHNNNSDNLDTHNIKLNPNRKKILSNNNNNQNSILNDYNEENDNNEINQQPQTNFYHDDERNVTEEISNATMGKLNQCLGYIGKYFNVELHDLKLKLKGAIIPFNKSFYQSIEINSDLYGPFWILTTIIFLIALIGNFSAYILAEDKENFVYNYTYVPHAIFIIYGFGFGAPLILWIISKFIFRIDIDLMTNMCIYGYSYTILVPILILCIIPLKLIDTLALLYFLIHSCTFLFFNMYLIIEQKAPKAKYFVLALIGGIQLALFFLLKFYFF